MKEDKLNHAERYCSLWEHQQLTLFTCSGIYAGKAQKDGEKSTVWVTPSVSAAPQHRQHTTSISVCQHQREHRSVVAQILVEISCHIQFKLIKSAQQVLCVLKSEYCSKQCFNSILVTVFQHVITTFTQSWNHSRAWEIVSLCNRALLSGLQGNRAVTKRYLIVLPLWASDNSETT